MKINSSVITMAGASSRRTISKTAEKLTAWVGNRPSPQNQVTDNANSDFQNAFRKLKDAIENNSLQQTSHVVNYEEEAISISDQDRSKIDLLNRLIEALTGKKMKFYIPDKLVRRHNDSLTNPLGQLLQISIQPATVLKGWGLDYQRQEYYSEEEEMSFQAGGTVTTSDGKNIQFKVNLNLSRSFVRESNFTINEGDALVDPLVINYGQPSSTLTTNKFSFDLDLDGKSDQISFTKSGSGFLAYDKNGDGKINDGNELFGPKTGNGFLELKQFDSDGNNWIDENDPIFDKLQIWTKDENGQDQLFAIGKKGIGAIYLGSVDTDFSLKDISNATLGQIRQTGIFLREDGSAGTVQHIDVSL